MKFRVALALAGVAACGEPCVNNPCPEQFAFNLTIKSATTGAPVTATVIAGPNTISCPGSCSVPGGSGTYHLQVSATGYSPVTSDATVTENPAHGCGSCVQINTQALTITLTPTTPG